MSVINCDTLLLVERQRRVMKQPGPTAQESKHRMIQSAEGAYYLSRAFSAVASQDTPQAVEFRAFGAFISLHVDYHSILTAI